jgi:hypothetical protein
VGFKDQNNKERLAFVELWAEYVRTHPDGDWSSQQNLIINSALKSNTLTKEEYLSLKESMARKE